MVTEKQYLKAVETIKNWQNQEREKRIKSQKAQKEIMLKMKQIENDYLNNFDISVRLYNQIRFYLSKFKSFNDDPRFEDLQKIDLIQFRNMPGVGKVSFKELQELLPK